MVTKKLDILLWTGIKGKMNKKIKWQMKEM